MTPHRPIDPKEKAMTKPVWIVLEGGDGAGKGIAAGIAQKLLEERGMEYIRTREPGGTEEGELLRNKLLGEYGRVWEKTSEIMLMTTSRVQHVAKVIRPHIARGVSVLCDRYVHSTLAYQGYGHQGPIDLIRHLHQHAVGGDMPDLTIILDIDPEVGIARARQRLEQDGVDEGRMEGMAIEFHRRVRQGYLDMAAADPQRHMVVDASRTIPEVGDDILIRLTAWLDEQDGWLPWHGRYGSILNAPNIDQDTQVMVKRRSGGVDGPYPVGRIEWHHQEVPSDIMFYKIHKER